MWGWLMTALIARLTFVTLQSISLIAGLTFVAELSGRLGRSDALFQFFYFQTDFFLHANSPPFCVRLIEKVSPNCRAAVPSIASFPIKMHPVPAFPSNRRSSLEP